MIYWRFQRWARFLVALPLLCLVLGASQAANLDLEGFLTRFDAVQNSIHTLSAEFTETTENSLLKDPIVATGRVYLTKPDSVRWEYIVPEEMRFVIAEDRYTGYFPARKQAEKRNIKRWREQLFRFLGLGQASAELKQFYDMRLEESGEGMENSLLLVLDPKKKRVRKRMQEVRFWVDASTYLPTRIEYLAKKGNTRRIEFTSISVNPDLAANLYKVEIPSDVTVSTGFSALSGFGPETQD